MATSVKSISHSRSLPPRVIHVLPTTKQISMIYSKYLEAEAMEEEGDEEDFLHLLKLIEFYSLAKKHRRSRSPIPRSQTPKVERLKWSTRFRESSPCKYSGNGFSTRLGFFLAGPSS